MNLKAFRYIQGAISGQHALMPDTAAVFSIKSSGALIAFAANLLLSRILGAEKVGVYFLSLTVINIAIIFGMVGLGNALIRFSAQCYSNSNWSGLSGLYRNSLIIVLVTTSFLSCIIFLLAPWLASSFFHKPDLSSPLRWMCLGILPMNIVAIHINLLKGTFKPVSATLTECMSIHIFMIVLLIVFRNRLNVTIVAVFYLVSTWCLAGLSVYVFRLFSSKQIGLKGSFDSGMLIKTGLPLFGVAIMNLVMSMTDTVMLGMMKNSSIVGIYGAALRISTISSMLLVAANTILAPRFSILYEKGAHGDLSQLVRETTFLMAVAACFFLSLLAFFPDFFMGLFGKEFISGSRTLMILALGQFIVLATGPVASLLMMTGHEKFHRNTTALSAAVNIMLNSILIPWYGSGGAAVATAFSLALKNILAVIHVRNKMKIRLF